MLKEVSLTGVAVRDAIIDYTQTQMNQCTLSCGAAEDGIAVPAADPLGYSVGLIEHSRWPKKWTPLMLDFLRRHSLSSAKAPPDGGPHDEIHLAH